MVRFMQTHSIFYCRPIFLPLRFFNKYARCIFKNELSAQTFRRTNKSHVISKKIAMIVVRCDFYQDVAVCIRIK